MMLSSCLTIKESDLVSDMSALPDLNKSLEPSVDLNNLSNKISYGKLRISGHYNGVVKLEQRADSIDLLIYDDNFDRTSYLENPDQYSSTVEYVPEIRIYDLITLFSNDIYGEDYSRDTSFGGRIELELTEFRDRKNIPLALISICTMGVPSLVGFPFGSIKTTLTLKLSIFNSQNELVSVYTAEGKGSAFIAMYWGYGDDVRRKSLIRAYRNAMFTIGKEIETDKELINSKLSE